MNTKFTPGPWTVSVVEHETMLPDWHVNIGDVKINMFPYKRIYSADRSQSGFVSDDEQKANIELISAAPELYLALERAYKMLCEQEDGLRQMGCHEINAEPAILGAQEALAKARGEQ